MYIKTSNDDTNKLILIVKGENQEKMSSDFTPHK